jgi:hypothetical protein
MISRISHVLITDYELFDNRFVVLPELRADLFSV